MDLRPPSLFALFHTRLAAESMTDYRRYLLALILELTALAQAS
jgi:hypothetical protein